MPVDVADYAMRSDFRLGRIIERKLYGEHGQELTQEALGGATPAEVSFGIERWVLGNKARMIDAEEYGPYGYRIGEVGETWRPRRPTMFWATAESLPEVAPRFTGCEFVLSVVVGDGSDGDEFALDESWFCVADVAMDKIDSMLALQEVAKQGAYGGHGCELTYRASSGIRPSWLRFRLALWNNGTKVATDRLMPRGSCPYHAPRPDAPDGRGMFWEDRGRLAETHPGFTGCEFVMSALTEDREEHAMGESWFCPASVALSGLDSESFCGQVARMGLDGTHGCGLVFKATGGNRPAGLRFRIGRWVDGSCIGMEADGKSGGCDCYPVVAPRDQSDYRWCDLPTGCLWSDSPDPAGVGSRFTGLVVAPSLGTPDGAWRHLGKSLLIKADASLWALESETNLWWFVNRCVCCSSGGELVESAFDATDAVPTMMSFRVTRWADGTAIGGDGDGVFGPYGYSGSSTTFDGRWTVGGTTTGSWYRSEPDWQRRNLFWRDRDDIPKVCPTFFGLEFSISVDSPSGDGTSRPLPESLFCSAPIDSRHDLWDRRRTLVRKGLSNDHGGRLLFMATGGAEFAMVRYRIVRWVGGHEVEGSESEEYGPCRHYMVEASAWRRPDAFWAPEGELAAIRPSFTGCGFSFAIESDDGTGEVRWLPESWFCEADPATRSLSSPLSRGRIAEQGLYGERGRELVSEALGGGRPTRLWLRIGQWVNGAKIATDGDGEYGPYGYRRL